MVVFCFGYLLLMGISKKNPLFMLLAAFTFITGITGLIISPSVDLGVRILSTCVLLVLVSAVNFERYPDVVASIVRIVNYSIGLSLIGFVYAVLGGPYLLTIDNPDGRQALFYLTTLSNSVFPSPGGGTVIRPSFIFDEPGAYAFVIDSVLLISYMVQKRLRREELFLIIGGAITLSIAHMLVALFVLISARKNRYVFILLILIALIDYLIYSTIDYSLVFQRFMVEEGKLAGENRSELFKVALGLVQQFPEGVGGTCGYDIQNCFNLYGAFGENPAFPAAFYGILPTLVYYLIIFSILSLCLILQNRIVFGAGVAIIILISQRPFIFNLGYNIQIILLLSVYVQTCLTIFGKNKWQSIKTQTH